MTATPAISGSLAGWLHRQCCPSDDVWIYDGTTVTEVTSNGTNSPPQISGSNVVYINGAGTAAEVYVYDANSLITTQITNNALQESNAKISGDNMVWTVNDGDLEVVFYDGATQTATQLTNNSTYDYYPQICDSDVVWYASDGFDLEVYHYDGSTTTQITNDNDSDSSPKVSGSAVFWIKEYLGDPCCTSMAIYFYDTDTQESFAFTPPTQWVNSFDISGMNIV